MKKRFTGLLVAAAITGLVFSCGPGNTNKQLLVGTWYMDSIDISKSTDSSLLIVILAGMSLNLDTDSVYFRFDSNGWVTNISDSENQSDSGRYEWESNNTIFVSEKDSTRDRWTIQQLTRDKLVLITQDSIFFHMNRLKEK
ncbi:MAG TPA: lipocalin family protein [Chitinophagaceae bacterium]|nr:lipocalin family protein [Chitinophagaceae bacterium]